MEDSPLRGNLSETPIAPLLFQIWKKEKSGTLRLKREENEISLYFEKGDLTIERSSFPEKDFLKDLFENNILDLQALEQCEAHSQKHQVSFLRALLELGILGPARLWRLVEDYWRQTTLPLFDWESGEFGFDLVQVSKETQLVQGILTPSFILSGLRRMESDGLIQAHLPQETETLLPLSPYYQEELSLEPPEKYVLSLIDGSRSLRQILESSELGRRACARILYAFLTLGLVGPSQPKNKARPAPEASYTELNRIFEAFNEKCSYVYKYMSKELGPLALNILDKCLDEIRMRLDPAFQSCELSLEGRIMLGQGKGTLQFAGEEGRRSFLRTLDEILTAEVLAVKRTLGPDHESVLVKNLEKVGDLG